MTREAHPAASVDELIDRARAGDEIALGELFHRCQPRLESWASHRLAHQRPGLARPSDIAQETALRAFRAFSTFKGATEAEWISWLKSILETTARQSRRDAGRQKRDSRAAIPLDSPEAADVAAPGRSPSQTAARGEAWKQIYAHIFQLPDEQRQAIWHCHLHGLPVAEAAQRMGKTEAAVAGLVQRGVRALQQRMGEGADETRSQARTPVASAGAADALLAYLRRRDAGEPIDGASFVSEHPSCAGDLREMIDWIACIETLRPAGIEE